MRQRWLVYAALWAAMIALRQDFLFWDDPRLVFGVLPAGLAWQASYSLLAVGVIWALVRWDWPAELDELEERPRE